MTGRKTMRRIEDRQLAQLSSMKELQVAKLRVNRAIRRTRNGIRTEYFTAKDKFSWMDAVCYGFSVIDSIQSVLRYLGKGVFSGVADKLFHRFKRGSESCDYNDRCR